MSALLASQICSLFILLIGTFVFGVLPILVQRTLTECDCVGTCKLTCRARKGKRITSFLIYGGGGVLLATCFIHLLPEAREGFENHDVDNLETNLTFNLTEGDSDEESHHEHFPIPELIVCCGFFAVYLFEEIITFFVGGHSHVPTETRAIRSLSRSSSCQSSMRCSDLGHSNSVHIPNPPQLKSKELSPDSSTDKFSVSSLLTVAALSFHSLFEGFAVGLQKTAVDTWILFAAISVHKYVIAFVVGLEVLASGGGKKHLLYYMIVFSLMSPLGMAIAMYTAYNFESDNQMTVSVLNAIATGTLLYVTFFEILERDEHKDLSSRLQLLATFSGFAIMCLVQYGSTFA